MFFPLTAFAYVVSEVPSEIGPWFQWLITEIGNAKGQGWYVILGISIWALVGICKFSILKTYFDKLGKWKFTIPIVLAVFADLFVNFPNPFTWGALLSVLVTSAGSGGTLAIAFHHIIDSFKKV